MQKGYEFLIMLFGVVGIVSAFDIFSGDSVLFNSFASLCYLSVSIFEIIRSKVQRARVVWFLLIMIFATGFIIANYLLLASEYSSNIDNMALTFGLVLVICRTWLGRSSSH